MTVAPMISGLRRLLRLLVAAVVPAWMAIVASGDASASAASSRPNHHCPCETKCRGASCCCPDDAPAPEEASRPAPSKGIASPREAARPCFGSVPCGGGEVPSAPPGSSSPKATIEAPVPLDAPQPGDRLLAGGPSTFPATTASRLDEPPERAA